MRHGHMACAALLDPSVAEPLVWPSPWKFMSELDPEAKLLLEEALVEANSKREKNLSSSRRTLSSGIDIDMVNDESNGKDGSIEVSSMLNARP